MSGVLVLRSALVLVLKVDVLFLKVGVLLTSLVIV